jgi:UDP-N-acetylmuramoyl-L-alanyl-D-glutamate--2,6-diaminopimelate ligase
MMLSKILTDLEIRNFKDVPVKDIQYDSRRVKPGDLFVAFQGRQVDGHAFIEDAIRAGACALIVEKAVDTDLPFAVVPDARALMPELGVRFYGDPSQSLKVIGITGTDGKTTTTLMMSSILEARGDKVGLMNTLAYRIPGVEETGDRTTPESLDIQRYLAGARDAGARYMVLEASSPGLAEGRLRGVDFDIAVITNFRRDHMDYHGTMGRYLEAKLQLFKDLEGDAKWGVINTDDPQKNAFLRVTRVKTITYGTRGTPELLGTLIGSDFEGIDISVSGLYVGNLRINLCGEFNLLNALASLGSAWALGIPFEAAVDGLQALKKVPGRMERITVPDLGFEVFVDYAHTSQGLSVTLKTLKPLTPERLIVVFGAGGDRDRGKRPQMGSVVSSLSDLSVVTSDNPRGENPDDIIRQILVGSRRGSKAIVDREEAIDWALREAKPGDTVLIAGKGSEGYQEIAGTKHPFDDREVARKILKELCK